MSQLSLNNLPPNIEPELPVSLLYSSSYSSDKFDGVEYFEVKPAADWIVIYGDMMALLLCFFVMLFSISTLQKPQIQNVITSLQSGFNNKSTVDRNSTKRPAISLTARQIGALNSINSTIQTVVFDLESIPGGIIRFASGSDELTDEGKSELSAILDKLRSSPYKILICGHESNNDEGGAYSRELDLSYARAVAVYEFLVSHGVKRESLQVMPIGKNEPLNNENNALVELKLKLDAPK
ncbi:MAG: OmpA family protein [Planctomycetaceae bacterium]|jgi:chemotaxis protein MotB|nr:OmpA family protein [Planctomycetaceae bacterium]